jgi:hypothetical protein
MENNFDKKFAHLEKGVETFETRFLKRWIRARPAWPFA